MSDCNHILLWLAWDAMEWDMRDRFPAAQAAGYCHLCHVALNCAHDDCPCLHWYVNGYANAPRLRRVLERYGLVESIQYLCLCAVATRHARPCKASVHTPGAQGDVDIRLRLGNRRYSFLYKPQRPDHCYLEVGNLRSAVVDIIPFQLRPQDHRFLSRLLDWKKYLPQALPD